MLFNNKDVPTNFISESNFIYNLKFKHKNIKTKLNFLEIVIKFYMFLENIYFTNIVKY